MSRVPEETLQQILAATDIVDLVGRYVKLRRAGVNWVGLCPFHTEKSPSFNVSTARGTYHCFGCGAGGNAFRFVMEHDGLTFMDAVKRLADAAHIRIEEEVWDANAERVAKIRNGLVKLHTEIAEWYHELLMKSTHAEEARSYLKSRGINADTARNWKMGYAPASGALLRQWAEPRKFTENLLVAGGILARGDEESGRGGEVYPRFRHRLMFPIRNDFGEIIAFSGRLLDANAKAAKYLNSPETVLFNKSKVFFGLDKSKRPIIKANRAIVCEGQLDLITAFEHGFENVVAPLGTAFTEFHARMLKRHAEEVVLCFDSDNAGYKAAERAFVILAPIGLIVKVAPLPKGEDPDSLIRGQGPEAFQATLDASRDFFDHMIDYASSNRDLNETREKTRFAGEMASMIRLLESNIARDAALQKVAMRLGIPEAEYRRQVAKTAKPAANNQASSNMPQEQTLSLPPQDKTAAMLCALALSDEEILDWLRETDREEILKDISGTELLSLVWNSSVKLADPAKLTGFLSTLKKEEESALSQLHSQSMPKGGLPEAVQALDVLEMKRVHNLLQRAQSQLKQPGIDAATIVKLNERVVALRKEYLDRRTRLQNIPKS
jgi:DNA primase